MMSIAGRSFLLLLLLLSLLQHVFALSELYVNVILVSTTLVVLVGAIISCAFMYFFRGSKVQPPLSSLENRSAHDIACDENINVDGKKKRVGKKDKEKRSKDRKSKERNLDSIESSDVEQGTTIPLLRPEPSNISHIPSTDKAKPAQKPPTSNLASDSDSISPPIRKSLGFSFLRRSSSEDARVSQTYEESPSSVPAAKRPPIPLLNLAVSEPIVPAPGINVEGDVSQENEISDLEESDAPTGSNVSNGFGSPRLEEESNEKEKDVGHKHFLLSSSSDTLKPIPPIQTPVMSAETPRTSVLQEKLAKLKIKKDESESTVQQTISPRENPINRSASLNTPTVAMPSPRQPQTRSMIMNSALRNTFLMTLSEGVLVVHHTEKGGQPSKLRYADNVLIIEKRSVFSSKKTCKFSATGIKKVEVGRKTPTLIAAGTGVQDQNCLSLLTSDGIVDLEMTSKQERDALVEGFRLLIQ